MYATRNSSFFTLLILCLAFSLSAQTPKKEQQPPVKGRVTTIMGDSDVPRAPAKTASGSRMAAFELVWRTINENYFDPSFNGVNWLAVRNEFAPQVAASKTDLEFHLMLQRMINRIGRSHFYILPPDAFEEVERVKARREEKRKERLSRGASGITESKSDEDEHELNAGRFGLLFDLRVIDNEMVVSSIAPKSTAFAAGLRAGYILESVDGVEVKALAKRIKEQGLDSDSLMRQFPRVLLELLNGDEGTEVEIGFRDEADKYTEILVVREPLEGTSVSILPDLPEQMFRFESTSLTPEIGLIKFNLFAQPLLNAFCGAVTEHLEKKALIIDLRGNMGGSFSSLLGISSLLLPQNVLFGEEIKREGRLKFEINPMPKQFRGRIIMLTDSLSVSAAEIMAAGLKENGRAVIVGERTPGEALPSRSVQLPTGGTLVFPYANFLSPTGGEIEGKGVTPDREVVIKRADLLLQKDRVMDAAIEIVRTNDPVEGNRKPIFVTPAKVVAAKDSTTEVAGAKQTLGVKNEVVIPRFIDPKALSIIREATDAIGGQTAWKEIKNYVAKGSMELTQTGSVTRGAFSISRAAPNKLAEVMDITGVGSIREVYNGEEYFVQSPHTGVLDQSEAMREFGLFSHFRELFEIERIYQRVTFSGSFFLEGELVNVVEATTADGIKIIFAFSVKSKFLKLRRGTSTIYNYDRYTRFGDVLFPTEQRRNEILKIRITDVEFNIDIPDIRFKREDNCFTSNQ